MAAQAADPEDEITALQEEIDTIFPDESEQDDLADPGMTSLPEVNTTKTPSSTEQPTNQSTAAPSAAPETNATTTETITDAPKTGVTCSSAHNETTPRYES